MMSEGAIVFSFRSKKKDVEVRDFVRISYDTLLKSGVPQPVGLRVYDVQTEVTGFDDDEVHKALTGSDFVVLIGNDLSIEYHIITNYEDECSFFISCPKKFIGNNEIQHILRTFLSSIPVFYAHVHDYDQKHKVLKKHYRKKRRTFNCSYLHWLTYFRGEELRKQGGEEAIIANPYITSYEKINDGLLLQVNESLEACLTPEGQERLISATDAMPPASWK